MPLETGSPPELRRAQKGARLWLGDQGARREGENLLSVIGPEYGIKYSWDGYCSSAMDSLRLVLFAQSKGKNEEFMSALGWRHFGRDAKLSERSVLLDAAEEAGLSRKEAQDILEWGRFAKELRECSDQWGEKAVISVDQFHKAAAIPLLRFKVSGVLSGEESCHGSVPQAEIERILRRLERHQR